MKIKLIITTACAIITTGNIFAGVLNFENAKEAIGSDVGNFFSGVTFGPDEQVIEPISIFPPESPTHVLIDANVSNPVISFVFDAPQKTFSFFYTAEFGFTGEALNSNGQVLDTFGGDANVGSNSKVTVTDNTSDITTVILTDKGNLGTFLTFDNLSAAGVNGLARPAVPETASTMGLFAVAGIALLVFRGKTAAQH